MGRSVVYIEQAEARGDDRAVTFSLGDAEVLLLADGAGGSSGGAAAAELFIRLMQEQFTSQLVPIDPLAFEDRLREIDILLLEDGSVGETTAIVAAVQNNSVVGASVGDSSCWIFNSDFDYELSSHQYRKPLLGSGQSVPVGFGAVQIDGNLVVGSDGLFRYTSIEKIKEVLEEYALEQMPLNLTDLVRLRSGGLSDDVSIIVYES